MSLRADHVVYDYQTSKVCCGHCGAEEALVLPMSVTVLVERTDAFLEQHAACQPKTAYRPGAVTDPPRGP